METLQAGAGGGGALGLSPYQSAIVFRWARAARRAARPSRDGASMSAQTALETNAAASRSCARQAQRRLLSFGRGRVPAAYERTG